MQISKKKIITTQIILVIDKYASLIVSITFEFCIGTCNRSPLCNFTCPIGLERGHKCKSRCCYCGIEYYPGQQRDHLKECEKNPANRRSAGNGTGPSSSRGASNETGR